MKHVMNVEDVSIRVGELALPSILTIPETARGVVAFAHGSGSSRMSPRNRYVASVLNDAGLATLLFDLLTREENEVDQFTAELRFDIDLLASRMIGGVEWLRLHPLTQRLRIGLFGASTGAAAALVAATLRPSDVAAIVSRGGRPDLAADSLDNVHAPVLLIVGGRDEAVIGMNESAGRRLSNHRLEIVPEATHLFEEPGTLEKVAELARDWFAQHLR